MDSTHRARGPREEPPLVVAVDGPAAAGKGTLARRLAAHFRLAHLDTGRLYRALGRAALAHGAGMDDAAALAELADTLKLDSATLADPALGDAPVAEAASRLAALPAVRAALLGAQRAFADRPPGGARGSVLDGRDVGTVVCPEAPVKLFVTADPAARAARRHREHLARGDASVYESVLADLRRRDGRDRGRQSAPLRPAADAVILDTTEMDAAAAFEAARAIVAGAIARRG